MAEATQQAPEAPQNAEATTPEAAKAAPPKAADAAAAKPAAPAADASEQEQAVTGLTNAAQKFTPQAPAEAPAGPVAPKKPVGATTEEEESKPKQPAAEEPETPAAGAPPKSKFLTTGDNAKLLEAWQLKNMPEELEEAMAGGGIKKTPYGFEFTMENGSKFSWTVDANGKEFIGTMGIFTRMTPELATAEVAAAKAHGWEEVDVHGSRARKEILWLAAQRAGLTVANFEPRPDSEVAQKWEEEKKSLKSDISPAASKPAAPAAETPAAPEAEAPAAPAAAAAEAPKTDTPAASKFAAVAAEPPQAEAPAAPAAETPAAPAAEAPKTEAPKTDAPKAAKPEYPQWEADKALFASKPEGTEVSTEGRKNVEAVEGMTKRAEGIKDPAHREGIEKLQDAIKSGKVKVDGPLEREIINNIDSPKGFNKAAEYFTNKSGGDLGISKVAVDAANNENSGQRKGGPKVKTAAP